MNPSASSASLLERLLGRLRSKPAQPNTTPVAPARPFQAVAIFRSNPCCAMARRLDEHRFLAKDAPSLPLSGCTMPQKCTCRFLKFKDRRSSAPRRLMDFGAANQFFAGKDRRLKRGRRASDR